MPTPRDRLKAIPWALLLEAAVIARNRWGRLTPGERQHLVAVLKKVRGRPADLDARDRKDLRRIAEKLDLGGVVREVEPLRRRWLDARRKG
jgi:hypothetical protein